MNGTMLSQTAWVIFYILSLFIKISQNSKKRPKVNSGSNEVSLAAGQRSNASGVLIVYMNVFKNTPIYCTSDNDMTRKCYQKDLRKNNFTIIIGTKHQM